MADRLREISGIRLSFPRQANAVFVELPGDVVEAMHRRGWMFYSLAGRGGCRLMCSWDTTADDVEEFVHDLKALLLKSPERRS